MDKRDIVTTDFKEAQNHVATAVKKKNDKIGNQKENVLRQQRKYESTTYSQPLSEKGRENYEKIFGHS